MFYVSSHFSTCPLKYCALYNVLFELSVSSKFKATSAPGFHPGNCSAEVVCHFDNDTSALVTNSFIIWLPTQLPQLNTYGICWGENSTCVWLNKNSLFYNKNVSVGILTLTISVKNKHSNGTQYDGSQLPAGIMLQPTLHLPAAAISLNSGPISTTAFHINHFNTKIWVMKYRA